MEKEPDKEKRLTEHFFRNEYGKMVSVITKYVGLENVETAEDIVQETLLKAVDHWKHNGLPPNPKAWLYKTAKHLTFNSLKRKKYQAKFAAQHQKIPPVEMPEIEEELIADEQLKMMFACCHPSISDPSKIALILKILCGFSQAEIASAFFTNKETINKRLVRGRKQLRQNKVQFAIPNNVVENQAVVLKTIFLLFNEGYSPAHKNEVLRYDLCLEAIRLSQILIETDLLADKSDCYALLALMYLNVSRFASRMSSIHTVIEMEKQDRTSWNQDLINRGIHYLNEATKENKISEYLILAAISANHCIAATYEETNWEEILMLYDNLLALNQSSIVRLNRCVALAKAKGNQLAITELLQLQSEPKMNQSHLFHTTLGQFYCLEKDNEKALKHFELAISLSQNERDQSLIKKKMMALVPID